MINFYHRFLPNIAATLSPLYGALESSKPRQELVWSQEMKQAFLNGKTALANAAMLVHPCTDCPLALTSDASDVAVGAVLEKFKKGHWQPLAFFSPQLRKADIKYSAFDRELLGVYLAIRHFRFMLEGREFHHLHRLKTTSARHGKNNRTMVSATNETSLWHFRV